MGARKFPFKTELKMNDPITFTLDAADAYLFINWLLEEDTNIDGAGAGARLICEQVTTQLFETAALKAAEAEYEAEKNQLPPPLAAMFGHMGIKFQPPFPNPEDFNDEN